MLTAAGSGSSRCGELAITRWREDVTRDDWGAYVFLRDAESGNRAQRSLKIALQIAPYGIKLQADFRQFFRGGFCII